MRRLLCILTILICIGLFSACSSEVVYIDDETDDSPLIVYLPEHSNMFRFMHNYNAKVDLGGIQSRKVEIMEYSFDQAQDIYKKISTQVMSGKGPDLLYLDDRTKDYLDIYRLTEQDVFADLDMLIKNDRTFKFDFYNESILDVGVIDDKRLIMPISYTVPYLLSTQENFVMNDLEIPTSITIEEYCDMAEIIDPEQSMDTSFQAYGF